MPETSFFLSLQTAYMVFRNSKIILTNRPMIQFSSFTLKNGLRVIVNPSPQTPLVTLNILYGTGARDEDPQRTGFAHLFEHLMFGGSRHIPDFDRPLQQAGGENNAFTNNDITNYYITIPKENLETALWLESDRMLEPDFSEKTLAVQKQVVIEEYKQRYLNQPYGDVWLLLRPLAYKKHPYRWPTIGKDIKHIEQATLEEVKDFFYSHYAPNNAYMALSGNITREEAEKLINKWFGDIPARTLAERKLPAEPQQQKKETLHVERRVPADALYMAFHMDRRLSDSYYTTDLISDILSNGKSSRLYQHLIKKRHLFSTIDAYITGSVDPGLFVINGTLLGGTTMEIAEEAIMDELYRLSSEKVAPRELGKVKNRLESTWVFSLDSILNRAMYLSYYTFLGDASMINREMERYRKIKPEDIHRDSKHLFREGNISVLYYHAGQKANNDRKRK